MYKVFQVCYHLLLWKL